MALQSDLKMHLAGGFTTVARCWAIIRKDGQRYGFTDHDLDLSFEGFTFRADTGLSAVSLEQSTGLSIDNTEALGALSDTSVSEADIDAGRFDGAEVMCWLANWSDVAERSLLFRGSIGELRRAGGAFQAELRGLTEALNRPVGRVYQKPCTAVLGDAACGVDLDVAGYHAIRPIEGVEDARVFRWSEMTEFEPAWFTRGTLRVQSGSGEGLNGLIKRDTFDGGLRVVELWEPIRALLQVGDQVRLEAGCDKRFDTCRLKFVNLVNFQGFPDIPGDDWMMSYPRQGADNSGGSLRG
ncbi:phage conserved hypothetical protein BR0599 [Shimia gijangensis]|uniref:Bacteriophage phiJL001 Gp84 C-terminal domain-containing protein n=1 Tax=Shimia gijangensis TaxID=1470563 RepID=A0A1M6EHH3_9RHOB|nr:DUF2163 domain-containing protein [Shimia gijangensis]SHI84924.1 phage conserved hypothetical protein BR0599 [Shimia gijangensis]